MPGGSLGPVEQTFAADASAYIAEIGKVIRANRDLLDSLRDIQKTRVGADTAGALAGIAAVKAALGDLGGGGGISAALGGTDAVRHLQDISTYMDIATDSMGRMEEHLIRINKNTEDSSASLDMQTQMLRDNAAAHNAATAAVSGYAAATAAAGAGRGSGGGGGGSAAAAAAGGFFGALRPSAVFGGALPTVRAAHMITMFTMEALSTIIPAAVAAAAAGAVGIQGGQNLYLRGQGMYTAAEALGPAYGTTFGQMIGMGSAFQQAQNAAAGGVYGIAGGLRDLASSGQGMFSGMGTQTIAMIDRGIAAMVLHSRMAAVSGALAGGTGYLRSFGDIAANVGSTLLNLVPAMPGIGPDLLAGLKGITGAASFVTGHVPVGLLGAGLAAEAGYRWGSLLLGGGKLPFWLGGGKFGGAAGMFSRMGLGGLSQFAAEAAGGPALMAALAAYAVDQIATSQTPQVSQIGALQAGIGQSFGAGAWQPVTRALYELPRIASATAKPQALYNFRLAGSRGGGLLEDLQAGGGPVGRAETQAAQTLGDLIGAGPQAVRALQGIGVKGATLGEAFQALTEAMISPKDIGPGGKLDATAAQQLRQFTQTYSTLAHGGTVAASGLLAASGADYIMATPQMKSLSQINQNLDSMTQIMTGGAAGTSALFGMLGGRGVTTTRGGIQAAASAAPSTAAFAAALQSPFTAAGAAAWQAFAGPNGIIAASQQNMDQLRTYQTLGALNQAQTAQLGAFEIGSYLPQAQHSQMALAMVMQQGMQAGVPGMSYYNPKLSLAHNYRLASRALAASMPSGPHAQALLAQGTIATANLPAVAADLLTGGAGTPSVGSQALINAASQALAVQQGVLTGKPDTSALQGLVASLIAGGVTSTPEAKAALRGVMAGTGLTGAKLNQVIHAGTVIYHAEIETPHPGHIPDRHYKVIPDVQPPHIPGVPAHHYSVVPDVKPAHIPHIPDQHFAIIGDVIISGGGAGVVGGGGRRITGGQGGAGIVPAVNPAAALGRILAGHQAGYMVPGTGTGDTYPALLEPGEAVVPRHLVPAVAPFLGAHGVPGFQAGIVPYFPGIGVQFRVAMQDMADALVGYVNQAVATAGPSRPGGGGGYAVQPSGGPGPAGGIHPLALSAVPVHQVSHAVAATLARAAAQADYRGISVSIVHGLDKGIRDTPAEAAKLARSLVARIGAELGYARGVASAAEQGQGYSPSGTAGLLSSFGGIPQPTVTAGGQPYQYYTDQAAISAGGTVPVQQQMADYLQAERSFSADLGTLGKGHLSKALLGQLIGAGPVQGDALAQSILSGPGGIGAANSLWNGITAASRALGATAAGLEYGGRLAPSLSGGGTYVGSGGMVINVSIGGGVGGDLQLTTKQVNELAAEIQKKLLQQGKRNRRTGVQLAGYGA